MKKLIIVAIAGIVLTSCSFTAYKCPSYGATNQLTKYGAKAQSKYHKKRI